MKKSVAVSMSALLVGAGFMAGMIATVNLYGPARTRDLIEEEAKRRTFNYIQGVVKQKQPKVHGTEDEGEIHAVKVSSEMILRHLGLVDEDDKTTERAKFGLVAHNVTGYGWSTVMERLYDGPQGIAGSRYRITYHHNDTHVTLTEIGKTGDGLSTQYPIHDALIVPTAVKEEACIAEAKKIAVSYITNMHQMIGHVGLNVRRVVVDKSDWMVILQHIGENRHYYRIAHKNGSGTTIQDLGTTWDMSWVGREIDRGEATEEHAEEIRVHQEGWGTTGQIYFHDEAKHLDKIDKLTQTMRQQNAAKINTDKNRG